MNVDAPKIDPRAAPDVVARLVTLLQQYTTDASYAFPSWKEFDPASLAPLGRSAALVGIFARITEMLIERLNQVPQKNFLAFLDLLGASRQPPQPARVPLTFLLAAGSAVDAQVPPGTQVAAPPGSGEKVPVIFETERPLVVTAAQLTSLLTLDPDQDSYADRGDRLGTPSAFTVFQGDRVLEHILYLGDVRLLGYTQIDALSVQLTLTSPYGADSRALQWERWDGAQWQALAPTSDGTNNLTQSGTIVFGSIQPLPEGVVDSLSSRWLRCRLLTPITPSPAAAAGMVRESELPMISGIVVSTHLLRDIAHGIAPDLGFLNAAPLDLSKEFFPFGDKPKLYDVLYLASSEAFSKDRVTNTASQSASVQLDIVLANPSSATDAGSVLPSADLVLVWESWNGTQWQEVGRGGPGGTVSGSPDFADGTSGLSQSGTVTLRLPGSVADTAVNGQDSYWLRVRLIKGDYGKDATYTLVDPSDATKGYLLTPASFRPPVITSIRIGYELTPQHPPQFCLAYNQLSFTDCTAAAAGADGPFAPFSAAPDAQNPGLYLGFTLPAGRAFPNTTLSLYNGATEVTYGERAVPIAPEISTAVGAAGTTATHAFTITNASAQSQIFDIALLGYRWLATAVASVNVAAGATYDFAVAVDVPDIAQPGDGDSGFVRLSARGDSGTIYSAVFVTTLEVASSAEPPSVAWSYWNGAQWFKLAVQDDSENFTRSGLLQFLAPSDIVHRELFGRDAYWLRAEWDKGAYAVPPRLDRVLLNTTLALQTTTVVDEILGSSSGTAQQQFQSTRSPVLAGQQLEVRETELPSGEEQAAIRQEEGDDAIDVVLDAAGQPREIWVRWHEVPDFYGSGPRDRHYVIDHLTGELRFGDGANGLVPPRGTGNLRLARYQTGGGSRGNRAAGAVAQLKTTVPYVEKASNPEAAAGGAEAETTDALLERMPRTLRHRDRAVTTEDYEDLALLATPEVARSLCVPLCDLSADPLGAVAVPGTVSVIVVPRGDEAKPLPTMELLARVEDFLIARAVATATPAIVGPLYLRVDVRAEIAVSSPDGASAVESAVRARLDAFLHPLTGGLDGSGWDFGRAPHRSDLFALLESVPGVDHVRYLLISEVEDQPGVRGTGRFLVFSGEHQISLVFEED
jgi:hypothetical protein